ncbi:MAG TPA: hypothetical protein VH062_00310 [Polyangiaceae bacterium]|jgi:hypothetical protein|nr:hypothetical protein [Polyangiaceae bacterium]
MSRADERVDAVEHTCPEVVGVGVVLSEIRSLEDERMVIEELLSLLVRELDGIPGQGDAPRRGDPRTTGSPDAIVRVRAKLAAALAQLEQRLEHLRGLNIAKVPGGPGLSAIPESYALRRKEAR